MLNRYAAGINLGLCLMIALVCPLHSAVAEPSPRDLQVLARALGFLERAPVGPVDIGIVYPQQSATGRSEAERVAAGFGDGLRVGNLTLRPKLVSVDTADQAGTVAMLLTDAAVPHAAAVARAVAGRSILTVSSDRSLVDAGLVVMVVRSEPRVEILVSRAATQAAGVTFAAAFRMMIQER